MERAYGSNGLSLPGCKEDVDILADGVKIQYAEEVVSLSGLV